MSKSVEKISQILDAIANGSRTLTSVASACELPMSTAYRLLSSLVRHGLLSHGAGGYSLGVRLIELGERARRELRFPELAREPMTELARNTKETVHLGILDGKDVVYLEKVNGARGLQMASYVGLRSPAQCTAMGKVLIAAQPEQTWPEHFDVNVAPTQNARRDSGEFLAELGDVRRAGYAFDREENEVGIRCVAAPIRDSRGAVLAAVSISGASIYIDDDRQHALVPEVVSCAEAISRRMGTPWGEERPGGA